MKSILKVGVSAVLLTALTAWVSWLGVRDWDGETGGKPLLMLAGLPLWASVIALPALGMHPAVAWAVGLTGQFAACFAVAGVTYAVVRLLKRPARSV